YGMYRILGVEPLPTFARFTRSALSVHCQWATPRGVRSDKTGSSVMKILGAGLSKTGTTSLHRALGILGFKSLHFDDRRLNDIIDGSNRNPDFRRYDDLDAVLDIPAACFYQELLHAYPRCRCILTVRDEDQWWKSIESHFNSRSPVASWHDNPFKWSLRHYAFGAAVAREFLFRKKYRAHNAAVVRHVPAERLLVMDVAGGDGWASLCPFLDVAVPAVPFPHQNPRDENGADSMRRTLADLMEVVPD